MAIAESAAAASAIIASVQSWSVLAVGVILGFGGFGTAIAFALLGGKFLESAARQPEMIQTLQKFMFIFAGFIDVIPIIGVAIAMLLLFLNPFLWQVTAHLA